MTHVLTRLITPCTCRRSLSLITVRQWRPHANLRCSQEARVSHSTRSNKRRLSSSSSSSLIPRIKKKYIRRLGRYFDITTTRKPHYEAIVLITDLSMQLTVHLKLMTTSLADFSWRLRAFIYLYTYTFVYMAGPMQRRSFVCSTTHPATTPTIELVLKRVENNYDHSI